MPFAITIEVDKLITLRTLGLHQPDQRAGECGEGVYVPIPNNDTEPNVAPERVYHPSHRELLLFFCDRFPKIPFTIGPVKIVLEFVPRDTEHEFVLQASKTNYCSTIHKGDDPTVLLADLIIETFQTHTTQ